MMEIFIPCWNRVECVRTENGTAVGVQSPAASCPLASCSRCWALDLAMNDSNTSFGTVTPCDVWMGVRFRVMSGWVRNSVNHDVSVKSRLRSMCTEIQGTPKKAKWIVFQLFFSS